MKNLIFVLIAVLLAVAAFIPVSAGPITPTPTVPPANPPTYPANTPCVIAEGAEFAWSYAGTYAGPAGTLYSYNARTTGRETNVGGELWSEIKTGHTFPMSNIVWVRTADLAC